jgi:hypothetical protein
MKIFTAQEKGVDMRQFDGRAKGTALSNLLGNESPIFSLVRSMPRPRKKHSVSVAPGHGSLGVAFVIVDVFRLFKMHNLF